MISPSSTNRSISTAAPSRPAIGQDSASRTIPTSLVAPPAGIFSAACRCASKPPSSSPSTLPRARPINEYIFPDDIYTNPGKFVSIFERFEKLCFCGHTHVPGVFLEGPDFYSPDELDYKFTLANEKAIINVGSVGQPRDRDPRTSFVVVTDTAIEFVRLPYDVETTVKKVEQIPELDDFLGTRLIDGR